MFIATELYSIFWWRDTERNGDLKSIISLATSPKIMRRMDVAPDLIGLVEKSGRFMRQWWVCGFCNLRKRYDNTIFDLNAMSMHKAIITAIIIMADYDKIYHDNDCGDDN